MTASEPAETYVIRAEEICDLFEHNAQLWAEMQRVSRQVYHFSGAVPVRPLTEGELKALVESGQFMPPRMHRLSSFGVTVDGRYDGHTPPPPSPG